MSHSQYIRELEFEPRMSGSRVHAYNQKEDKTHENFPVTFMS